MYVAEILYATKPCNMYLSTGYILIKTISPVSWCVGSYGGYKDMCSSQKEGAYTYALCFVSLY